MKINVLPKKIIRKRYNNFIEKNGLKCFESDIHTDDEKDIEIIKIYPSKSKINAIEKQNKDIKSDDYFILYSDVKDVKDYNLQNKQTTLYFDGVKYYTDIDIFNTHETPLKEIYKKGANKEPIKGKFIKTGENVYVFVKENEEISKTIDELKRANDFGALKEYEKIGNVVWEHTLMRDHKHDEMLKKAVEQYGNEYFKIAKGHENEK